MTVWIRRMLAAATAGVLVCAAGAAPAVDAQASLVFQTTFACPEWNQAVGLTDAAVCSIGDGIAGYGAWTTSAGDRDQITLGANNPTGSGGLGFGIGVVTARTITAGGLQIRCRRR